MGFYIQGPALGKAAFFKSEYDAEFIEKPASFQDVPQDKAIICVVNNGPFEAAGYAFSEREFEVFAGPDTRSKTWMLMDKALAEKLTGRDGTCPR